MSWIWISKNRYPTKQNTKVSCFCEPPLNYAVVSFEKDFSYSKKIASLELKFAADTSGYLMVDNNVVFSDNAKTIGDFSIKNNPVKHIYYLKDKVEFSDSKNSFKLKAFVQLGPTQFYDFSSGHGGLYVEGKINFEDGSYELIETDSTWNSKVETSFTKPFEFDNSLKDEKSYKAVLDNTKRVLIDSEINNLREKSVYENDFIVKKQSKKEFNVDLPLCYASHYEIEVFGNSEIECVLSSKEVKNSISHVNKFKTIKSTKFRFFNLVSCGGFNLNCNNKGNKEVTIRVRVLHSYYPFEKIHNININDKRISNLFEKCSFAARNCSQSILLDSPKHCEPSGSCAGDYNIISLVDAFLTGDYSLSVHHLKQYAKNLEIMNGVNTNSSYALIFVKWLKNVYMINGDKTLINDCIGGVKKALDLYKSFIGESGLIEKSYNYIFVDWLVVDGFSLFSPPKNLGQSVTTMFFYDALNSASFLYKEIGNIRESNKCKKLANLLKKSINSKLFDEKTGLYIEGLNTKDEEQPLKIYKPDSVDKIYYGKHANILAAAFGLRNKSDTKKLVNKIFKDPFIKDLPVQPYFDHYLFEAIHNADLDKKYFFHLLKEFTMNIKLKDKGLPEGFYKPEPTYAFDFSHAWACSPYYSFINATLGLKILEPGFKKIKIKPMRCKFDFSYVLPTMYGNITVKNTNKLIEIKIPKSISVIK